MAKKILDFTVDTIQSTYSLVGTVKQLDSVFFNIQITENGAVKNITEQTIRLFAKKSDNKLVEQRTDINIINASEGKVSIDLLNAALQCTGLVIFELEISDNTGTISTANFILKVQEKIANDKVIESTTEISALKEIEDYVVQAKIEIQEFKALKDDMVETNNNINVQENLRVQAENLRIEAELNREKSLKNLNQLKTNYFGKEFNTPQERFLNEFEYLNKGEEKGSFLPFSTNKSHKVQESIEGKTRNMILEGETLQNLLGNSGTNIELVRANNGHHRQILKDLFKQGSYYTFIPMVRLIENVDNSAFIKIVYVDSTIVYKKFKEANSSQINNICLNFEKDIKELKVELHVDNQLDAKLTLDLIALEGDWTNKEMPNYFEGIKSVGEDTGKINIKSNGKNLYDGNIITGLVDNTATYRPNDTTTSVLIKVRELKTYQVEKFVGNRLIIVAFKEKPKYMDVGRLIINNNSPSSHVTESIKTEKDETYVIIYVSNERIEDVKMIVEEGTIATAYEPYKENKKDILLPFEGGLKSVGNTKDEINSISNKAIKKNSFKIFDGNNNVNLAKTRENTLLFSVVNEFYEKPIIKNDNTNIIVNNFPSVYNWISDCEGVFLHTTSTTYNAIYFGIAKSKLQTQDVEGFKRWLRENPTTVYYELAEPIEYDLNKDINLNTYKDLTYITTEAPSTFSAPVIISSTIARLNRENKTLEKENIELKKDTKLLASAMLNILEPMLLPGEEINSLNTGLLKELNKIVEN